MARTSSLKPGQHLSDRHIALLRELPITQNNPREVTVNINELDAMLDEIQLWRAKYPPT